MCRIRTQVGPCADSKPHPPLVRIHMFLIGFALFLIGFGSDYFLHIGSFGFESDCHPSCNRFWFLFRFPRTCCNFDYWNFEWNLVILKLHSIGLFFMDLYYQNLTKLNCNLLYLEKKKLIYVWISGKKKLIFFWIYLNLFCLKSK